MAKANKGLVFEDKRGNVAPAMKPVKGSVYEFDYTATAGVSPEITEQAVRLTCTSDAFVKIGETDAVVASAENYDFRAASDNSYDIKLFETDKYISVVQSSTSGTAYLHGWV